MHGGGDAMYILVAFLTAAIVLGASLKTEEAGSSN